MAPAPGRLDRLVARLKTLKGAIVAIAGVGAVMGGLAGYWNAYQAARGSTTPTSLLALVGTGNAGPLSIVVLPFANLTGDPQQAYLADGLTAALTADLSRIRDAFIVSPATAFAYKDKPVTVQQIGKELGVRFALQGGVQRNGTKIRINAQLADTTTNAQLWSESFDGDQGDLFALQDMVTTRIGNGIGREMLVVAARESDTRKSDPRTVDVMLRARALGTKPVTLRNFEEQQALHRQVLSLEPNNAQAMAGLAVALSRPVDSGFIVDAIARKKQMAEARDLALKAKGIDPSIADIYFTLALSALARGDTKEARRAVETSLSLDPKNPDRYNALALDYFYAGAPAQAIEVLTKAIHLDPRNVSGRILMNMGRAQFMFGDDDVAIQWLLKAIDASPDLWHSYPYLAMAYARKGDLVRARAATVDALRVRPKLSLSRFEARGGPGHPDAYLAFWENRLAPAARLAGFPGSSLSETYFLLVTNYLYAGAPARAIELFNQGLRADPQHVSEEALLNRGIALFMIGDTDAAIESLLNAVELNPSTPDSHAYLAMAYARRGDHARTRAAVGDLLRTEPRFSLAKLDAPTPGSPEAYRVMWETKVLPAGRLAGLPE